MEVGWNHRRGLKYLPFLQNSRYFVTRLIDKFSCWIFTREIILVVGDRECDKQIDYFRVISVMSNMPSFPDYELIHSYITPRFACFLPPKLWLFLCFPFLACQCWESATGMNVCAGRPCFAHTVVNLILSTFELVVNLNCKLSIYLTYGICNKALYLLRLLTSLVAFCTYCTYCVVSLAPALPRHPVFAPWDIVVLRLLALLMPTTSHQP